MKKKLLLLALPLIIAGCGKDSKRIDVVKNHYINEERTIQLGKMLDARKICAKTDWDTATDDLGQNLVIYECKFLDNTKEFSQEKQRQLAELRHHLEQQLAQQQATATEFEKLGQNRFDNEIARLNQILQTLTMVEENMINNPFDDTKDLGFEPYAVRDAIIIEKNIHALEVKLPELLDEIAQYPTQQPARRSGENDYSYENRVYQWKQDYYYLANRLDAFFQNSSRIYDFSNRSYLGASPILTKWIAYPNIQPNVPLNMLSTKEIDFVAIRNNLPEIKAELQRFIADLKLYKYELLATTLETEKQPVLVAIESYKTPPSIDKLLTENELRQYQYAVSEVERMQSNLDNFESYSAGHYREYDLRNFIEKLVWVINDKQEAFFLGGVLLAQLGPNIEEIFEYTNENQLYEHLIDSRDIKSVKEYVQSGSSISHAPDFNLDDMDYFY